MNGHRIVAKRIAAMSALALTCLTGATASAQQGPPSKGEVDRALAKGSANAGGPFTIIVTGDKTASVSGRDASFCVSSGSTKVFALSLVESKWAVSISAMGDRPGVGEHVLATSMTKGISARLTDKTTGSTPADWVRSSLKSGTLTITRADETKLSGTYEFIATPTTGGEWRAKGAFEANPTKC
jgi:hypothetical protein